MKTTVVREGETLGMLSARLGVPGCMILRANALFCEAWLLPGREIDVPSADYCTQAQSPCPVQALHEPALEARRGAALTLRAPETAQALAARLGRPHEQLRLLCPLPDALEAGAEVFVPQ